MIKFDIKNTSTGKVKFTVDIDCDKSEESSVKLGIAVKVAIKSGANLSGANLSGANLSGANLSDANLLSANLSWANLSDANLSGDNLLGANLSGANLSSANLLGSNLSCAKLLGADLLGANLSGANLSDADLSGANLSSADLSCANLLRADISGANLRYITSGNCIQIITIKDPTYKISDTEEHMAIGCQQQTIKQWFKITVEEISKMDERALEWWRKWKRILRSIMDIDNE